MEEAGTVDDPAAIKAAFSEILPMDPEVNLVAYMGIRDTRMLVPGTVQVIENGKYQMPVQNIWWPENKAEFEDVLERIPEREVISEYLPIEDYIK